MRLASFASVGAALFLIVLKFGAFLETGSVSVLSSLFDSALDAAASIVNLIAIRQALVPADAEHRFGHGKAEPLAGLVQVAFILGSSVVLAVEVVNRFRSGAAVTEMETGVAVMVISLLVTGLLVLLQRQWLPFGLLLLMAFMSLWTAAFSDLDLEAANVIPAVLANAAMVGAAYWLMSLGLREDRGIPFAAGVAYFLLWSVLRYIDLFGDFGGMLGAALMFFLCGAALFGVAFYWRRRKELRHA